MATGLDTIYEIILTFWDVIKWTWWLFIVVWLIVLKVKWKNWPLDAVIIEKRGNNLIRTNDRAGKYSDPYTNITGYRLMKAKDTIPVLNFEWILHYSYKPTNLFERLVHLLRGNVGSVFFFKYGTKQYKPIYIQKNRESKRILQEMKDKDGNPIFINIYEQFDPRRHLGALDFEVVDWDNMNFMVQEQRASILRRQKQGEWVKQFLIPILIIGASIIFCIIMIKYGYDFAINLKSSGTSNNQPDAEKPATVPNIPIISDILNPGQ
jgi:hypothetical protein